MKKLTVVIVNYNTTAYLDPCLESIHRMTRCPDVAIVVVDNASRDNDFTALQRKYPGVAFLKNSRNHGFARACNLGLRHTPAEFYLLLNPDTVLLDPAIDQTLEFLDETPGAGIVGCRVTNPDGTLQKAARRTIPDPSSAAYRLFGLSRIFSRSRRLGRYNLDHLDENATYPVEAVSGSFLMFRNQVFEETGGLDEDFFLYGEDLDFCYRALKHGWKIYYFHRARVIHHKGASSSQEESLATFHFFDAMRIFYRKHYAGRSGPLKYASVMIAIELLYRLRQLRRALSRVGKRQSQCRSTEYPPGD